MRDGPGQSFPDPLSLWRVFPYDASAAEGEPYSVRSVAPLSRQTSGRFDLGTSPVLYLAETPAHGVAEVLRRFTGKMFSPNLLLAAKHPLAVVSVRVPPAIASNIVDLADPEVLVRFSLRPDTLALPASERKRTQAVARRVYEAGVPGFRWWSALHSGWHSTVLFLDRAPLAGLNFGIPELLTIDHPAVLEAAGAPVPSAAAIIPLIAMNETAPPGSNRAGPILVQ